MNLTIGPARNHSRDAGAEARVAHELYQVESLTRSLSLSSKNLGIMASRIGSTAAGLAQLANFFDEFSEKTRTLAAQLLAGSVQSIRNEVEDQRRWRCLQAMENCERRFPQARENPLFHRVSRRERETNRQALLRAQREARELRLLIHEMEKSVTTIMVIAVNAKVEAPSAGEYSGMLSNLTQRIEAQTTAILNHIKAAGRHLGSKRHEI